MTEHAPEQIWSNIDIPKTVAGVMAAVSAAVIGSFLGVAGTLAGAAIASVVGSVGTELYKRWIDRGSQKIKSTFVTAPAAVGTPPVRAAHSAASELEPPGVYRASASVPAASAMAVPPSSSPRPFRWGRAVAVAAAFFVLAVALLTVFELVTHRSIADAVGSGSGKRTTIGSVLTGHDRRQAPPPAETPSPSPSPSDSPSPTQSTEPQQGGQPTTEAPATQTPTTEPPATQGTEPPTQGPTGQSDTGGNSDQGGTGFQGGNNDQGGTRFRGGATPTPDQE